MYGEWGPYFDWELEVSFGLALILLSLKAAAKRIKLITQIKVNAVRL